MTEAPLPPGNNRWTDPDSAEGTALQTAQIRRSRPTSAPRLLIEDVAEVASRVRSAPAPGWLARPVWPEDAYGVIAAESKAGKTWAVLDLAVAVAAGTPWMGTYATGSGGRVLVFLGEASERKTIRRLDAVASFTALNSTGSRFGCVTASRSSARRTIRRRSQPSSEPSLLDW